MWVTPIPISARDPCYAYWRESLVLTPRRPEAANLDLCVNYGQGFHSNDVRGAFASPRVGPLPRSVHAHASFRAGISDLDAIEDAGATRRRVWKIDTR